MPVATFLPTARTPTSLFLLAAVGAFFALFTMVVAMDTLDRLLVLLAFRTSSGSCVGPAPLLALVFPTFVVVGLLAFRVVPAFGRPALDFSPTMLARLAVAAAVATLAGETILIGEKCFSGEAGCERYGFCGEHRVGRTGDWGKVRELADLGERTEEGLVTWRDGPLATLVRFLGFGISGTGPTVFSLSADSMTSL